MLRFNFKFLEILYIYIYEQELSGGSPSVSGCLLPVPCHWELGKQSAFTKPVHTAHACVRTEDTSTHVAHTVSTAVVRNISDSGTHRRHAMDLP